MYIYITVSRNTFRLTVRKAFRTAFRKGFRIQPFAESISRKAAVRKPCAACVLFERLCGERCVRLCGRTCERLYERLCQRPFGTVRNYSKKGEVANNKPKTINNISYFALMFRGPGRIKFELYVEIRCHYPGGRPFWTLERSV